MKKQTNKNGYFPQCLRKKKGYPAVRITLLYFLFGTVWVFFSDRLLHSLIDDKAVIARFSMAKGMLFVVLTAMLILYLIVRHLTEIDRQQDRLNYLAYTDELTGLPNKVMLKRAMSELMALDTPFAVTYVDIDNFKTVNDRFGHAVGDWVIAAVGERIHKVCQGSNMLFLVGSDEYVIVSKILKQTYADKQCALKIFDVLSAPFTLDEKEIIISASVGVAFYPDDGLFYDKLLSHANLAMFAAKTEGKGCCKFYAAEYSEELQSKSQMEADIKKGIRNQEFELYYQPIVCLKTGRIHSLEALVRWNHPEKGRISPCDFIPVAEESGLIIGLGEAIMRMGMNKAAELSRGGITDVAVSINISAKQLDDPAFCDTVEQLLCQTGVAGNSLIFEITESFAITDIHRKIMVLNCIKEHDIRIAIDDFGTGYSSLTYLSQLPVDMVKIDQSFVSKLKCIKTDEVINAIITVSHQLGLTVVAEGVETEEQKTILMADGCDYIQGYLISRPAKTEELILV